MHKTQHRTRTHVSDCATNHGKRWDPPIRSLFADDINCLFIYFIHDDDVFF